MGDLKIGSLGSVHVEVGTTSAEKFPSSADCRYNNSNFLVRVSG